MKQTSGFLEKISLLTQQRNQREKIQLSESEIREAIETDRSAEGKLRQTSDLRTALTTGSGLIAEIKRASPSQGPIAPDANPSQIAREYLASGASAISVLTEPTHFGGSIADLQSVRREHPEAVLLMKDFVIDPYQIYQARYFGADVVLLIVAMLDEPQLRDLHQLATGLGLSVLVEVHDQQEFATAHALGAPLIGINNRNLKTLKTDLDISRTLVKEKLPDTLLVAESGIENRQTIAEFRSLGFEGFLVGTSLMREKSPGAALAKLASR